MRAINFRLLLILGSMFMSSSSMAQPKCIAVVTSGIDTFWSAVANGALQAGKELNVKVLTRGAYDEANLEHQEQLIQSTVRAVGCKGLVLAPNSAERANQVLQLKSQGIPTVFIDRNTGGEAVSVIKTDNELAGRLAARQMVAALNGKGRVAVLRLNRSIISTHLREQGFIEEAIKGGLTIVIDEYLSQTMGQARDKAVRIIDTPYQIDGIFTPNQTTTIATIKAQEMLSLSGKFVHIGFDAHPIILAALKDGSLQGFLVQQPFQMGYLGVQTVYAAIQGETFDSNIVTSVKYVDKNNLKELESSLYIHIKNSTLP